MITREKNNGEPKVLVVGNHPAVNVSLRTMLSFNQLHVVATDDPEIAISLARNTNGNFALVLLDVSIPDIDPEDLADRLRSIQPDTMVLFFSSLIDGEVIRLGIIDPVRNVLRKEGVMAAIQNALQVAEHPRVAMKTLTAGGSLAAS